MRRVARLSLRGASPIESPPLHIVLYQPEIPYNTGSVGRTCVALGAKLWLVRPLGFRLDEHHVRRAGLDYWEHLDLEVVDDWSSLTERLDVSTMWFFTKRGKTNYLDVTYQRGDAFVFGRESTGLPDELLDEAPGRCLRIPTRDEVRCLNLSNSVAVAAYEAQRQLQHA